MHHVRMVLWAGLAMAMFINAQAWADEKTETHSGTVVSINGNQLHMLHPNGEEKTHVLAPNATVLCNGKACKLGDLKPGTPIRVTTPANDVKTALRVEAQVNKPAGNGNPRNQQPQAEQPQAEQRQEAKRPYLGVSVESAAGGMSVRTVEPNGPAAKAGLQNGDLIQKVAKRAIPNYEALIDILAKCKPGDKVDIHFKRGDQEKDATITLGQMPEQRAGEARPQPTNGFLGVTIRDLTQEGRNRRGIPPQRGALVVEVMPDTPAAKAGLQNGDVIMSVNDKPINGPAGLQKAIRQAGAGREITLKVQRGEQTQDFKAHLEGSSTE